MGIDSDSGYDFVLVHDVLFKEEEDDNINYWIIVA